LCSKGNNQQNEKAAYVLGENIYEPYFWLEVNPPKYISNSHNSTAKANK
jgi:hypothetical protein